MKFEIIGFIKGVNLETKLIEFSPMGFRKSMMLDIFTGDKKFSWVKDAAIKKSILIIIGKNKGKFNSTGYCYNSNTLISNITVFENEEELNQFIKFVWEKQNEN